MKKILLILAFVFTAGMFACSELPTDMNTKNVAVSNSGNGSIALNPQLILISFTGVPGTEFAPGYDDYDYDIKKGVTIADYLNGCLTSKTFAQYVKCIKRKVKGLVSKGIISADLGALILDWAEAQLPPAE